MIKLSLAEETAGYQTVTDPSNTDRRLLIAGSQNVLIDQQRKVKTRPGYMRFGAANTTLYPIKNAWRWDTSTGDKRDQRYYNGILEAYLGTIDGTAISAWTQIYASFTATAMVRPALTLIRQGGGWYDSTEGIDLQIMTQGDDHLFEWNGAVAVVASLRDTTGIIAVLNATPTAAGSGYVVGDVLTITSDGSGATATVTAVNGSGGITNIVITARGSTYTTGAGKTTSGGTGTGATLNITTIGTGGITKAGTTTFAQNRFYHTRNKTLFCLRTGTNYTYTDDASTQEIVGMGTTAGLVAGDVLIQSIVLQSQQPSRGRKNDIPFIFQNQLVLGSQSDPQAYISKNTSYYDFTYSSPRLAGEGGLLTLDGPTRAINALGTYLLVFSGTSSIFRGNYTQITVSTTLAETLNIQKFDVGVNQGALNHECVIPIGDELAYLTNDVSLRVISNAQNFSGLDPKTLSNPVKPDFDAEDWTGAFGHWHKNVLFFSAPAASHLWMLNFVQDANGRAFRFWNPPQVLPAGPTTTIDLSDGNGPLLYMHSSVVPETYQLFTGLSDGQYPNMAVEDKLPIHTIAQYAYDHMGKRGVLKTLDEYYVEGEINPNTTDLLTTLFYDFDGATQMPQRTINGTDASILEGSVTNNSLAQSLLAGQPLGGLLTPPSDARRFRVGFEIAREDFFEISSRFETNEVDRYWAIIAQGSNATLSPRKATTIKK